MTVRVTALANGFRIATDTMASVETVSVGLSVNAGSRDERVEVNGVAHLLEHMAFKGTARRTARNIAEEIEAVGGHLNAYTAREHTAFYAKVLREDVALAVDILADITLNSVVDPDELERERQVVLQEIGLAHDTPDDVIFDHFQEAAFAGQALGRPVLGRSEAIRDMPREAIVQFRSSHYLGPRMVLAAAGKVDHDALVALARPVFADLPAATHAPNGTAAYTGGDYREARPLEQVHFLLGFDGLAFVHPDYYAQSVLTTLLGGGMSSRLFQEVREARGLAYSIYCFTSTFSDGGLFGVYAGTGEELVAEMVSLVCDEVNGVLARLEEEEVARARAQLKAGILMALESTGARCEQLAAQLQVYGRPLPTEEVVAKIEAVDGESVQRVVAQMLSSRPTVAAMGPVGGLEPYEAIAARLG